MKTVVWSFKQIGKAIGILLLAYILYFFYCLATAEGRVKPLCEGIKPGMPFSDLAAISKEHGFSTPTNGPYPAVMVERKSYGRYGCMVTLDSGTVTKSEFFHND